MNLTGAISSRAVLLYAVLQIICSTAAKAQEAGDTLHLDEVEYIYQKKSAGPGVRQLFLDSALLAANPSASVGDLLSRYTPVFIKTYSPGGLSTTAFRGTAANHTKVYWNGIPLNSPMLGVTDLNLLPLFLLDDVQLKYGSASLQEGSGGIGGAIDLLNEPRQQQHRLELRQRIGSFGDYNTYAGIFYGKGTVQGTTRLYYHQAKNDFPYTDFYGRKVRLNNAALEQYGGLQQLSFLLKNKSSLSATFWYQMSKRALPPLMTSVSTDEHQQDESLRASLDYKKALRKGLLAVTGNYAREYLTYEARKANTYSRSYFDLYGLQGKHTRAWGQKLQTANRAQLFYNRAYAPDYDKLHDQWRGSLMSRWDWQVRPKLHLGALLRPEWVSGRQPVAGGLLSAAYQFWKQKISLYANIGRNHNFPNLNDLYWDQGGNPDLQPERASTMEAGTDIKLWTKGKNLLQLNATAYSNHISNYIQWLPGNGGNWQPDNLDKVWARGLEAGLKAGYALNKTYFSFALNYAYTRSEKEKTAMAPASLLIYIPQHTLQSWLRFEWKNLRLQPEYTFTGRRPIPAGSLPSYALLNFAAGWQWRAKKVNGSLQLRADNLLDETYQVMALRPMPGRNFSVNLSITLPYEKNK